MGNDNNQPIGQLISLYKTEIISRWKYMVEKGIFSVENFLGLFNDWLDFRRSASYTAYLCLCSDPFLRIGLGGSQNQP